MKVRKLLIIIFLLLPISLFAQYYDDIEEIEENDIPEGRWYLSPDFGLILGSITMIEVAPTLGFHLTPRLSTGMGFRYEYYRQLDNYSRVELINTYKYGIRSFVRLVLVPDLSEALPFATRMSLFTYAEYEALNLDEKYFGLLQSIDTERFWNHAILAGGGVSQQVAKKIFMNIMILWDITNTSSSPYINPIIRFGGQIYFK
ncbi:MAG: hypothetical protein K9H49_16055 [Bacteroidales bacterium]|nr:hypothetical protein [Bacteroidales bacterium]MCF8391743.1 hypothetical protein [Bacteroidales bacterium]